MASAFINKTPRDEGPEDLANASVTSSGQVALVVVVVKLSLVAVGFKVASENEEFWVIVGKKNDLGSSDAANNTAVLQAHTVDDLSAHLLDDLGALGIDGPANGDVHGLACCAGEALDEHEAHAVDELAEGAVKLGFTELAEGVVKLSVDGQADGAVKLAVEELAEGAVRHAVDELAEGAVKLAVDELAEHAAFDEVAPGAYALPAEWS
jgi:hypothetical protein